jgi:5-carboxymethyl-2-hydroxymuconate isomerase
LAAGTYVITLKLTYDTVGTAVRTDDRFLLQEYTVTVLTVAAALAEAIGADLKPGIIISNGEVSVDKVTLPLVQTTSPIAGVTYSWAVSEGAKNASITAGVLSITRLYSQDKVVVRGTANHGLFTAGNFKNFEFRVLPASKADIAERIELLTVGVFERAPRIYDIPEDGVVVGTSLTNLNDFLSVGDLGVDSGAVKIVWNVKDSNKPSLQKSAFNSAVDNLVFVNPATNQLQLGQNAFNFNGDVSVVVSATIEVRFDANNVAADVSVVRDFTLQLNRDRVPAQTYDKFLVFSGAGTYVAYTPDHSLRGVSSPIVRLYFTSGVNNVVSPVVSSITPSIAAVADVTVVAANSGLFAPGSKDVIPTTQFNYSYFISGSAVSVLNPTVDKGSAVGVVGVAEITATSGATEASATFVRLVLASGVWREANINSGSVKLDGTDMAADLKAAFNGFTVAGISEDGTTLVLKTSGALPSLLSATSGAIKIQPAAFYQTGVGTPTVVVTSYVGATSATTATFNMSGLTRVIRLTLTDAIWGTTFDSGMFNFSVSLNNADSAAAILSGLLANNVERVSDKDLLITASSGLTADATFEITVNSGAVISTSGAFAVAGVSSRPIALKDTTVTAGADENRFIITLVNAFFRSNAEGFDVSNVLITSSGTSLAAATNASVIRAALLNGDFAFSSSNQVLTISTGIKLDIAVDSINVEVLPAALIQGASVSGSEATVALTTATQ